jgi:3-hydroxyacyl-[acyl-carrier-protein] dehydratase
MLSETTSLDHRELLALLPQRDPFRFVDRILEMDDRHVRASYRFRGDEPFYAGHFPGDPVTPGVILLEAMAQGGVVLQALYLFSKSSNGDQLRRTRMVLTDFSGEVYRPVIPPETVTIHSEVHFWRARKLRSKVKMVGAGNDLIATAVIGGMGVFLA